ncbi:pseudouridine synthase [Mucilaginibacter sp. Bleaf8]|uniref:pseudouridine synthase n=1 Tax=Mucilaginibacter sp. Bleaf8 TaxID=2834430 RepID=UPI001BD1B418|nr:pseudouridine synthase [Mucilaginibacter sp. Bleaf8]MBS7566627.1 pseudouridine synthase [Mucilaginibacter sp. Bleaf8]
MVFKKPGNSRDDKSNKSSGRRAGSGDNPRSNSSSRTRNASSGFKKSDTGAPRKRFTGGDADADKKPFSASRKTSSGGFGGDDRPKRSFGGNASEGKRPFSSSRRDASGGEGKGQRSFGNGASADRKPFAKRGGEGGFQGEKKFDRPAGGNRSRGERSEGFKNKPFRERGDQPKTRSGYSRPAEDDFAGEKPARVMRGRKKATEGKKEDSHLIRLNRYISNAGICSRRKADELIAAGVVSVNGEVVSELGFKVDPSKDVIRYNGETLKREKMVYVLLNKPKDYITTTDDPQERRTVMHLVDKATRERIYPVGRLDRNTTGLLLMTNDGDLADKLSHPRNNITKLYQVELSKSLTQGDLNKIAFGLELEDGFIKPDMVTYVQGGTKREVGIQIHSGKNRIVRRIFEHLGYEVVKLDRTVYANLTKKDLPRGRWRYLDEKEIIQLKHLIN